MKSDTLFMNISTDQVIISDWETSIFLQRNDVEKTLWPKLVQMTREWNYKNVIVLNWPGGFTNLRVGTLCLNILNTLVDNKLTLYDISKIDLYKKAHEQWVLPRYWIVYIWQKRNIRLRDFEKNEKIWQYSFNELENLDELKDTKNVFIEDVDEESYYPEWMNKYVKYNISFDWNNISLISNKTTSLNVFSVNKSDCRESKSIAPNYMMEPSITMNK
jgi:hypothetical protein